MIIQDDLYNLSFGIYCLPTHPYEGGFNEGLSCAISLPVAHTLLENLTDDTIAVALYDENFHHFTLFC